MQGDAIFQKLKDIVKGFCPAHSQLTLEISDIHDRELL